MKKRLEADLISIAHRILQLKDKSDVNQLYLETQKLYEKLSVLKFIEENYADVKPTIGSYSEIEKEVENFYDKEASLPVETEIEMTESNMYQETEVEETAEIVIPEAVIEEDESEEDESEDEALASIEETEVEDNDVEFHESEPEIEEETEEETEEEEVENIAEEIPEFKAAFELTEEVETEEKQPEEVKKPETVQISFEDLLGLSYNEPEFVKVDEIPAPTKEVVFEPIETTETPVEKAVETSEKITSKSVSLNDKLAKKGIEIDLNDRIAFVKHLFGNSNEDYNRVMNQLITYDNFFETKSFIDEMVKPDYNDWEGKEEYEERFMEIIEKKFL